jgi:hypothetical protein
MLKWLRGRQVQADPMKPTVKAPIYERLKLTCDDLLSNVAFNFNLRRYTAGPGRAVQLEPVKPTVKVPGIKLCETRI